MQIHIFQSLKELISAYILTVSNNVLVSDWLHFQDELVLTARSIFLQCAITLFLICPLSWPFNLEWLPQPAYLVGGAEMQY